jgi:hypothetical protein
MEHDIFASLTRLADDDLLAHVKTLIADERGLTAEVIALLAELDARDAHLREGYTSLYVYCRDVLRLSEWEAYNRIEVARTARQFPVVLGLLADGSVNLTGLRLLGPHLTPDNHREVLEAARGKRKVEIQELVARLSPRPDVPSSVRRLPQPGMAPTMDAGAAETSSAAPGEAHTEAPRPAPQPPAAGCALVAASSAAVAPLSPDRYKLQVTIGGETLEKLRLAKDMLGHSVPSGDEAIVLDRALDALLAELAKKKFAATSEPGQARPSRPGTRSLPAAVKRAVWVRDLERCAFVGQGGHRCEERRSLEFHHVDPYALGGEATVDGIQLRCRRHNDYEGRLYFGRRRTGRAAGARKGKLVLEQVGLSGSRSTIDPLTRAR